MKKKATPRKAASKPSKVSRKGKSFTLWIDNDVHAAMRKFKERDPLDPKMKAIVILALREFLERKELLQPRESSAE